MSSILESIKSVKNPFTSEEEEVIEETDDGTAFFAQVRGGGHGTGSLGLVVSAAFSR